jgi:hypothetical protein
MHGMLFTLRSSVKIIILTSSVGFKNNKLFSKKICEKTVIWVKKDM